MELAFERSNSYKKYFRKYRTYPWEVRSHKIVWNQTHISLQKSCVIETCLTTSIVTWHCPYRNSTGVNRVTFSLRLRRQWHRMENVGKLYRCFELSPSVGTSRRTIDSTFPKLNIVSCPVKSYGAFQIRALNSENRGVVHWFIDSSNNGCWIGDKTFQLCVKN